MKRRTAREISWRIMTFGPAVIMGGLAVVVVAWRGWGEWELGFAYSMAALNMWLIARTLRTTYRSGYWAGRMDVQMEQLRLKARRRVGVDDQPEPWDPAMGPGEAILMRQAMENLTRENPPG